MLKIGHRAAAGYEVENTARAIKKALDLRVNMIELDVRRCASGELLVIHDKKIDRLTNGSGQVSKLTFAEIKKFQTFDGQKILTLPEALALIAGRCMVNLHIKSRGSARGVVDLIHRLVAAKQWSPGQFLVSSFNVRDLKRIKELDEKIRIGILYYRHILSIVGRAQKLSVYSIHLHARLLKKELVEALRRRRIKIFAWTLNSPADIKRAYQLKVDGIISDFPDMI